MTSHDSFRKVYEKEWCNSDEMTGFSLWQPRQVTMSLQRGIAKSSGMLQQTITDSTKRNLQMQDDSDTCRGT